jgi:thiol-disulfide isomerase/thioredoxin
VKPLVKVAAIIYLLTILGLCIYKIYTPPPQQHQEGVIMYGTSECPPCKKLRPALDCLNDAKLIKLTYIDIDKEPNVPVDNGVVLKYIPQISVYGNNSLGRVGLIYHGNPSTPGETAFNIFQGRSTSEMILTPADVLSLNKCLTLLQQYSI